MAKRWLFRMLETAPSLSPACDLRPPNAVNPARGFPYACATVTSATGLSFGRHRGWSPSNRRSFCHGHYRRSEEHTYGLQSSMSISYDVFSVKKNTQTKWNENTDHKK